MGEGGRGFFPNLFKKTNFGNFFFWPGSFSVIYFKRGKLKKIGNP